MDQAGLPRSPRRTRHVAPGKPVTARGWLLFVHQLPSTPSNLRVRTWRRLQQLGAVAVKQAVYALPDTPATREDFEWLRTEVQDSGGEAAVFAADHIDAWSDAALIGEFRRSREEAYRSLAQDLEAALGRAKRLSSRRRRGSEAATRALEVFHQRFAAIERIDFFGAKGRDRVATLLKRIEPRTSSTRQAPSPADSPRLRADRTYRGRLWVTRPRPGVDRMASAWLIKRYIDPRARFGFVKARAPVPERSIPFDMFGVEFAHRGDQCTFETLCRLFSIREPSIDRLAAVVHDLDLKDARFNPSEAPTIGALVDGLRLAHSDDESLLKGGMELFDALYRSFSRSQPRGSRRA